MPVHVPMFVSFLALAGWPSSRFCGSGGLHGNDFPAGNFNSERVFKAAINCLSVACRGQNGLREGDDETETAAKRTNS